MISKILFSNGSKNNAETEIEDIVPIAIPKSTTRQKFLISPLEKNTTGRIARIVVSDVPIVRDIVEFTASFMDFAKSDLRFILERILS